MCPLAKIWHVAQILPPPKHTRNSWQQYARGIYGRATFRIPVTTLQQQKTQGGWALMDVVVKCTTLLLSWMWLLNLREGSVPASWLKTWNLNGPLVNPLNGNAILNKLAYVIHYALDMAHITSPGYTETYKMFKRLYKVLHVLANVERGTQEMRITHKHPSIPWTRVWTTMHAAWVSEQLKSLWYSDPWDRTHKRTPSGDPSYTQNDATSAGKRIPSNAESQTAVKGPLYGTGRATKSLHYSTWTPISYRTTGLSALHSTSAPPLPHLVEYQMQRQTPNTQRLHRLSVMRQMEGLPKITQTAHHGKLPPHNLPAADTNTRTTLVHQIPADTRQWTKGEPKPPLPNQTYRDRGRNKKKKKGGLPPDIRLPELSGTYYHKTTCPEILYVKTKQINK